ncbi:MAG TPA: hypothetical protein VHU41_20905, partial [Thermoanaerobaculia bacterium]|nr:hypothetical protein [Thermoanaerobaculia bacterium]
MNVAAQAIVTTISRAIHGGFSARNLAQAFVVGGVAGYGFYEAKSLAGRGKVTSGWIVANTAASVTQNTVAGKNPLAQIGYSVGPIRFRIPIPAFDRSADSYVLVDASQ